MPQMKDSGITWCGQIPIHWNVMPNKYVMYKKKELCPIYNGEDILSLTMDGVIIRDLEAGGKMPSTFNGYQIVHPNNLLMCLFDYDVTPRCIGLIQNEGLTSPAYSQFVLKNGNNPKYYYYYYLMIDNTKELLHLAKNLRHSFTEDQLGAINAPVPPIEEQKRIASFLDRKCAEVDELYANIQKQIETLEEYKKSVITEAVTKGLNPDVEMKDSGIEWIGEIPKDWIIKPLKYFAKIISKGATPSDMSNEQNNKYYIRFVKAENIKDGYLVKKPEFYIDKKANYILKRSILREGDLLIVIAGATIGKIAIMKKELCPSNTNQAVCFIRLNDKENPYFYKYVLQSRIISNVIQLYTVQSAQPNLSMGNIANIDLPYIKDKNMEQEIVEYLDKKCNEIDGAIEDKKKQLEILEQYKKSLIYEYVTGKKEVPV